jgi:hypothetical protein
MKPSLIIAISIFAVLLSGRGHAATLSLENCAAIEDPVERLACYDTLAGRLPADTTKASSTAPSAVDPVSPRADVIEQATPAMTPDAEAIFGLEHKQKPEEELQDKIQLKWADKKKDGYGKWVITLENGQVWHQTDSRRFTFANPEQWVVISRGLFGSFFLEEPDRSGGIRVERVK